MKIFFYNHFSENKIPVYLNNKIYEAKNKVEIFLCVYICVNSKCIAKNKQLEYIYIMSLSMIIIAKWLHEYMYSIVCMLHTYDAINICL